MVPVLQEHESQCERQRESKQTVWFCDCGKPQPNLGSLCQDGYWGCIQKVGEVFHAIPFQLPCVISSQ